MLRLNGLVLAVSVKEPSYGRWGRASKLRSRFQQWRQRERKRRSSASRSTLRGPKHPLLQKKIRRLCVGLGYIPYMFYITYQIPDQYAPCLRFYLRPPQKVDRCQINIRSR